MVAPVNRIKICVSNIVEIEVESSQVSFPDLKKEAIELFQFASKSRFGTSPPDNDVT